VGGWVGGGGGGGVFVCVHRCNVLISPHHTEISADGVKGQRNGSKIMICCGGRKHSVTFED